MTRLNLLVLERDERAVLRELGESGALQLVPTRAGAETAPLAPRDRVAELEHCAHLLARIEELRRNLGIAPSTGSQAGPTAMVLDQAERELCLMEERAGNLLKRRESILQEQARLTADCQLVSAYRGMEIPLGQPDRYSFLHFVTGILKAENLPKLQSEIADNVALVPLPERQGRQRLVALTTRQGRTALDEALRQAGFQAEILPEVEGATTDSLAETSERQREDKSVESKKLNAEVNALANEYASDLVVIEAVVKEERSMLQAEQGFPRTETAVLVSGWAPSSDAAGMKTRVRQITGNRCAIKTSAADGLAEEQTPVLLRHARLLRPFEMLVCAYGLPNYHELEPTLFVALSYLLMFGIMFGDAGHGAVLATAGLVALLAAHTEKRRNLGLLLLLGGCSSMVFGLIYGSCFGLPALKRYALWHDPLEGDPMLLMYGAIGIGVVMISLGLVLNIINRFRRGDVIGGFLDKFGLVGVLFYWGVLVLIAKFTAIQSRGLVALAAILFLVVPILGWAIKEPIKFLAHRYSGRAPEPGGGFLVALTESLVGAFEAVLSYLANTISFVRLAAYAMSHAALLVAAFMMADVVRQFPAGGDILSVLVIILGNLVALVLEGIIASVQALRLEYYEFFGKFFSGTGRPFEPFRLVAAPA